MAYITYEQYESYYGTPAITEAEFPMYAGAASDLIDTITQFRILKVGGIETFSPFIQNIVEKACGLQIMYYIQQGGLETVLSGQTGNGFTVGKVHIDGGNASGGSMTSAQLMISPAAKALLEQTGLMDRSTPVIGQGTRWGWPLC